MCSHASNMKKQQWMQQCTQLKCSNKEWAITEQNGEDAEDVIITDVLIDLLA